MKVIQRLLYLLGMLFPCLLFFSHSLTLMIQFSTPEPIRTPRFVSVSLFLSLLFSDIHLISPKSGFPVSSWPHGGFPFPVPPFPTRSTTVISSHREIMFILMPSVSSDSSWPLLLLSPNPPSAQPQTHLPPLSSHFCFLQLFPLHTNVAKCTTLSIDFPGQSGTCLEKYPELFDP